MPKTASDMIERLCNQWQLQHTTGGVYSCWTLQSRNGVWPMEGADKVRGINNSQALRMKATKLLCYMSGSPKVLIQLCMSAVLSVLGRVGFPIHRMLLLRWGGRRQIWLAPLSQSS